MNKLEVHIHFIDPFRMVGWVKKSERVKGREYWERVQSFARWHKCRSTDLGRPFITGTLLRSVFIRAVEEELVANDGKWDGIDCCPGLFYTEETTTLPRHLRHRRTLKWLGEKEDVCPDNQRENGCPLCQLLGRFDKASKGSKRNDEFDVRFSNLNPPGVPLWQGPEEIGIFRTINRVDSYTGKAFDYFKIWEIDGVKDFFGTIIINDDLPHREAVISLLQRAAGFVEKLCGSTCTVTITSKPKSDVSTNPTLCKPAEPQNRSKNNIQELVRGLKNLGLPPSKLRSLASAVLYLRSFEQNHTFKLPEGKDEENGDKAVRQHHLWDLELPSGQRLRDWLTNKFESNPQQFREFCEQSSTQLLALSKGEDIPVTSNEQDTPAPEEGVVSVYSKPLLAYNDESRELTGEQKEWIFYGTLRAETPFCIARDTQPDDQLAKHVLLDRNYRFRLPRSTVRGVLRRDLGIASDGHGCPVQLGTEQPCSCSVCIIMRKLIIYDAVSEYTSPPDILQRIRRATNLGIALDEALFDMECGLQNIEFPFVLRFKGPTVEPLLKIVLSWWQDKKMFAGGNVGTGKGRFVLDNLRLTSWQLGSPQNREKYAKECGFRGDEDALCNLADSNDGAKYGISKENFKKAHKKFPWKKIHYKIAFTNPVLSSDPIAALCTSTSDSIFQMRTKVEDNTASSCFVLKSEGIRGMFRTAVGRAANENLLNSPHEDCTCALCRIFGSEHGTGILRFEDLHCLEPIEKLIHHNSIDRFDQSVKEKFDDTPLIGSPDKPLEFSGAVWVHRTMLTDLSLLPLMQSGIADVRNGFYPAGGRGSIGYGWLNSALSLTERVFNQKVGNDVQSTGLHSTPRKDYFYPVKPGNGPKPPKVEFTPVKGSVYNPYYHIQYDDKKPPERTHPPTSHSTFDGNTFSGIIHCNLTSVTPLLLPDKERSVKENGHIEYSPFQLNESIMVPASQIRASVSQVYEILTNSCLRVVNQKRKLSWRMATDDFTGNRREGKTGYEAGMVSEDGKTIIPCEHIRLPLYDNKELQEELQNPDRYNQGECNWEDNYRTARIQQAKKANQIIAEAAQNNIEKLQNLSPEQLAGKQEVYFEIKDVCVVGKSKTIIDKVAVINPTGKSGSKGYLKITGPNNAEVGEREERENIEKICSNRTFDLRNNRLQHNTIQCLTAIKKKFPRPVFICLQDGQKYTVTKRCERVFYGFNNSRIKITSKNVRQYKALVKETKENTKTLPPIFTSDIPEELEPGALVYFHCSGTEIDNIIPVSIFRLQDDRFLGKRIAEPFRPCSTVCLEDCDQCTSLSCPIPLYREGYPNNGLCPTCHLFGSQMYKGRVRFGFAQPAADKVELQQVTLPRQGEPRSTWVLPKEVKDKDTQIPGRRFYLRHDSWKTIWDKGKDPSTEMEFEGDENNITTGGIAPEQQFKFSIYVENLAPEELGWLLYSLQLEDNMAHSIGRGKPFGFGQVNLEVASVEQRTAPGICQEIYNSTTGCPDFFPVVLDSLKKLSSEHWYEQNSIKALRFMLTRHNLTAFYPQLKEVNGRPGYIQLKANNQYNPYSKLVVHTQPRKQPIHPWFTPNPERATKTEEPAEKKAAPPPATDTKNSGTVKWFNTGKGFGFIQQPKGKDVFVHYSNITGEGYQFLTEGDQVRFRVVETHKGLQAMDVEKI